MIARRSASGTVGVCSAVRPTRARNATGSRQDRTSAPSRDSVVPRLHRVARSAPGPATWAAYCSSRSTPLANWVPTTEPAEVPTTRSAPDRWTPSAASPASMPISQPTPVIPPPPNTSALLMSSA